MFNSNTKIEIKIKIRLFNTILLLDWYEGRIWNIYIDKVIDNTFLFIGF